MKIFDKLFKKKKPFLDEGFRVITINTKNTWPSDEEMRLRDLIEDAISNSDIATCNGTDAGAGSVNVFVRFKS